MGASAVLFDLYGTLADIEVDEQDLDAWAALKRLFGDQAGNLAPQDLRERFTRLCDQEIRAHGEGFALTSAFKRLLSETGRGGSDREAIEFAEAFRSATTKRLSARPYSIPLLNALRRCGLRLALVSNTEGIVTHHDIGRLGLARHFDAVVLSSESGSKKPSPAIFEKALRSLSARPDDAVFVGDTWETDIEGALRAGLRAVYLDPTLPPLAFRRDDHEARVLRAHPDGKAIGSALGMLICGSRETVATG